jgi:sugar lactone lactonase YvrE
MRKLALILGVAGVALGALAGGGSATTPPGTVVMSGLHNPRGLAFDNHGSLYVAEAGDGGAGPCAVFSDGMTTCYGPTGRVSRLRHGVQEVVASGLPSNAPAGGAGALGPIDLVLNGDKAYVTDGLGADPTRADIAPFRALGQGHLIKVHPDARHTDHWQIKTDVSAYEAANNPVGPSDSNPYGILDQNGRRVLTDAGGNDLLEVHGNHVSLLAVFPSRPDRTTDSVPTTVARGPDGAYYVGELSGAPFDVGAASVYRVADGTATVYCPGFTAIIDIGWGPDGHLYVLQFATGPGLSGPGALYRIDSGCSQTPVVTGLIAPGGLVFGSDGAIYISNKSVLPGGAGEVLRFGS